MTSLMCLLLLSTRLPSAQDTHKSISLTDKSNVSSQDISKLLRKVCPDVGIASDAAKSDYTLEAIETTIRQGLRIIPEHGVSLTLFNRTGKAVRSTSTSSLSDGMKDICKAIKTSVMVEVVDTQNLTQSTDARGEGPGAAALIVNGATGRRTHTDASTIYVIVNGEHALLDCYERRTGCTTIGPGNYYGEQDGDGIWVNCQMPVTHKWIRNHYKIAGSW